MTAPHRECPSPRGLLAELTHRCPLSCPYCSNPLELVERSDELATADWLRVLEEAAELGIQQIHLSGGEPAARRDLELIVARCGRLGLYSNLITSGIGLTEARVKDLAHRGLDHVQLSIQDADATSAERIGGYPGAHARKRRMAEAALEAGCALTINATIHSRNIERVVDIVALARAWGAHRVEIAHVQYYGWALSNRAVLMPSAEQVRVAVAAVEKMRADTQCGIEIEHVIPDYFAKTPKPCMGGWGRRIIVIAPDGNALPCHSAATIPGLDFWNVRTHPLSAIWANSPSFNVFRGLDWMSEPCRSCPRREIDFGGCRCQALHLTDDAAATDPACSLAPGRSRLLSARSQARSMSLRRRGRVTASISK